jgi:ADP-heptose:LPS heptosyltransferase
MCFVLAPIAYCVGKILRIDHSISENNVKTIVISKYFGLGSITHAVPTLRALKSKYPKANLIFITRINNKELLPLIPYIDKTLYINDSGFFKLLLSSAKVIFKLWAKRADLFFDFEVFSSYGTLMSLFSLARNRLGFFWARSTYFKTLLYTHLMYFNFDMPLRLSYMQLSHLADTDINSPLDLEPFNIDETTCKETKEKISKAFGGDKSKILCINVNASDLSYSRRWPLENFAKTARHFAQEGCNIILLGSPDEREYINGIYGFLAADKKITDKIFNAAGIFSLRQTLAALSLCDAFLTNDSGLMNLGYAQQAKTAALYGANDPVYVHIDNGINTAIYKKTYCSPCLYIFDSPPCGRLSVCMNNITAQEVIEAVKNILNTKFKGANSVNHTIKSDKISGYIMGTLRKRK